MPAVLRIAGPRCLLCEAMKQVDLEFIEAGLSPKQGDKAIFSPDERAGFNLTISEADGDQLPVQLEDAAQFLAQNRNTLRSLFAVQEVQDRVLDFSRSFRASCFSQSSRFPSEILKLCAEMEIDIELSVCATSDEE